MVTQPPSFKVTLQFEGEYVTNDVCYGHSYYWTRIGSYTQAIKWCNFRWPWVTLLSIFKPFVQQH